MARTAKPLIAALLALLGASAHAGYAQAVPPPGFTTGPSGGEMGRFGYAKAANEAWTSGTVRTTASLNVGGRTVTMPAAMRFAANAPRFAAGLLFASPQLRLAVAAVTWLGVAKVVWDEAEKAWKPINDVEIDAVFYHSNAWGSSNPGLKNHTSYQSLCQTYFAGNIFGYPEYQILHVGPTGCQASYRHPVAGWVRTGISIYTTPRPCPDGTVNENGKCIGGSLGAPLTKEEFEKKLAPEVWRPENPGIVPQDFPNIFPPGTPLPVETPVINPRYVPLPETTPSPNPFFSPSGDPYPNPNYNPNAPISPENQPFIQPGTRIKPSPTLDEPWRVDVEPVDRPQTEPTPKPDDQLNPGPIPPPNPDDQTNPEQPSPDANDQKKPEDQASLCEKHPDIAACAKLDDVEPEEVQNQQEQLSITPSAGWESGTATCPAPVTRQVAGLTLEMQWQPFCDLATGIRPVILALAWVAAAMMVIGVARRGD